MVVYNLYGYRLYFSDTYRGDYETKYHVKDYIMDFKKNCEHDWQKNETGNKEVCTKCKIEKLILTQLNNDIMVGTRDDGTKYSVRIDKKKYFMPQDWIKFYNSLNEKNKLLFLFLICTGARIEEALSFHTDGLVGDSRKTLKLFVTKRKAKKAGEHSGLPRSFQVSSELYRKLVKIREEVGRGFVFIEADKDISMNTEAGRKILKKLTKPKSTVAYLNLRSNLKRSGIKDPFNYSLHTIRKTHGMWLKVLEIDEDEICTRMGHDRETFLKHYGSPSLFQQQDIPLMKKILGDIYEL